MPDGITYCVYRKDGTLAGPLERVSAGQQGAAILNLLLASGDEPLLVDTPEEGLDNEGVYAELVPLVRREKERRQIVIVTHNANIPVNGDAEAILAMEAAGFLIESELEAIGRKGTTSLNAAQVEHLRDLIRWPDWEMRVGDYLRGTIGWAHDIVNTTLAAIGEARQAEGRIKRVQLATPSAFERMLSAPSIRLPLNGPSKTSWKAQKRRLGDAFLETSLQHRSH